MTCSFCGKKNPKDWTKYCSRDCAQSGGTLDWLLKKKKELQLKSKGGK